MQSLIPQTRNLLRRVIASSGSMLNPWSYQKKNHTNILQQHIAEQQSRDPDAISLSEIIEYLSGVNGTMFGEKTFAPVYEYGKSIKEIDLVWAPTIERRSFHLLLHSLCANILNNFINLTENFVQNPERKIPWQ